LGGRLKLETEQKRYSKIKNTDTRELTLLQSLLSEATAQMPTVYSRPRIPAKEHWNVRVQTIKAKCQTSKSVE
jgi:hypothetical protein